MRRHELTLPRAYDSVAAARRFVLEAAPVAVGSPLPPRVADDLTLVVSELVTNAVCAPPVDDTAAVVVALAAAVDTVWVGVTDRAPGYPTRREATDSESHGRGLALVAALAVEWGVARAADGPGKTVWAQLPLPTLVPAG